MDIDHLSNVLPPGAGRSNCESSTVPSQTCTCVAAPAFTATLALQRELEVVVVVRRKYRQCCRTVIEHANTLNKRLGTGSN